MVTTFAYLLEYAKVPEVEIRRQVGWLLETFTVVATTDIVLKDAVASKSRDYEDAVVEQAAIAARASVIVTRNITDFKTSAVPAVTPELFLA